MTINDNTTTSLVVDFTDTILQARGLDDAHAWLPPPIAKRFGRRLAKLGWIRDDAWTPYCFRLRANQK